MTDPARCEFTGLTDAEKVETWTLNTIPGKTLGAATRDELLRELLYRDVEIHRAHSAIMAKARPLRGGDVRHRASHGEPVGRARDPHPSRIYS